MLALPVINFLFKKKKSIVMFHFVVIKCYPVIQYWENFPQYNIKLISGLYFLPAVWLTKHPS